jgi:acyl-CoA thioesterase FadM
MTAMAGKVFEVEEVVRFAHCDPAGIVFFPQYLVMLNTLHERWFGEALGVPYQHYIGERRLGLPTVRLECDFVAVSRHGDRLRQRLELAKQQVLHQRLLHVHAVLGLVPDHRLRAVDDLGRRPPRPGAPAGSA